MIGDQVNGSEALQLKPVRQPVSVQATQGLLAHSPEKRQGSSEAISTDSS